ncbi:PASTA domain-containing protein [Kordia jejudonensis]|uniref:PASTA domain-containing protein n=1 Tax=Kordia jejudonensis TaxID=1348245 RepID=UPI0006296BBC|nr:PASTA domain-containing protein [Kordia jejudonensis]
MAVTIKYIAFKHILFDASDAPANGEKVIIQFYNVNLKSWLSLTDGIKIVNGKFSYQLTIPSRISTSDQTIRVVREVLKYGGMPSFRIVKEDAADKIPQVIAVNFDAKIEGDGILTINFGKSWLLKDDRIIVKNDHVVIASEVPMFELMNSIKEIEAQKEEATAQLEELNTTITSLANEREVLKTQLSTVQNTVATRDEEVSTLNTNMQTLQAEYESEKLLRASLEANQQVLATQLATQQEQLETYEASANTANNFEVLYQDLQQQVSDITIQNDNLTQERDSFLMSISQLQDEVQQEKLLTQAKDTELQNKQVLVTSLERQNSKLQQELEEVKDFNATEHPNKLSASKVYGSIVKDVIKADEELINSRYKLANVSLNLKTTVEKGPEGTVFGLLDFETAKGINGAAISDISIDIVPTGNTTANVSQKMPNILGLTETAVRKILLNNGLKLDAVYHPTTNENLVAGQSFKQSPAPDASIIEGQEVIVIFAKPIN